MLIQFDEQQMHAIARCCSITERIVPITGAAGSGKTTIMRRVYELLAEAGYRIVLCAPTGKAAKRIQEATGIEAMTIHRLLEYPHPGELDEKTGKPLMTTVPKRGKDYPLEYDIVLADEYAMVSHEVHRNLIDSLPRGGCIRAFGDVNQLPPIEQNKLLRTKESPFTEMLARFNGVILETNHRQEEGSGVAANGLLILKGMCPRRKPDFTIEVTTQPVQALIDHCQLGLFEYDISYAELAHQIIVPGRKSWVGTAKLNAALQRIYREERDGWITLPRHTWALDKNTRVRKGDKILWTSNNYDIGVFNGETGIIVDTNEDFGEIHIDFGDRVVPIPPEIVTINAKGATYSYDPRKDIDLAYAITTHKAQGSEYQHVVYILNKSHRYMMTRSNFYTGISRARKHVHLITDQQSLTYSVFNKETRL